MNILVITRNAWDDTNSIGNTMSNFFKTSSNNNIMNIYFRKSLPNNQICSQYFSINEFDVVKNWFTPQLIGNYFCTSGELNKKNNNKEKKIINIIHRLKMTFIYRLSDMIWYSRKWMNKKFDSAIKEFHPDLVFSFAKPDPQYFLSINYIKEKYKAKIVLWIADDTYTSLNMHHSTENDRRISNLRNMLQFSDYVYGCSNEICDYYNKIFSCKALPQYKQCSFEKSIHKVTDGIVKIVYAGNLLFGRIDTLKEFVYTIKQSKSLIGKVYIDIYSSTQLSKKEINDLNVYGVSSVHNAIQYNKLKNELSKADIVLHIESFNEKDIIKTKYSFSTKIIDYLQSGSTIMAIGPEELSSIRYIKCISGAIVLKSTDLIEDELIQIVSNPTILNERSKEIRMFALKNHAKNDWLENINM